MPKSGRLQIVELGLLFLKFLWGMFFPEGSVVIILPALAIKENGYEQNTGHDLTHCNDSE
jgi:hypothetical protein